VLTWTFEVVFFLLLTFAHHAAPVVSLTCTASFYAALFNVTSMLTCGLLKKNSSSFGLPVMIDVSSEFNVPQEHLPARKKMYQSGE